MSETRQFILPKDAQAPFFVGIDLGGTNIKVGVVDDCGRPLSYLTVPTEVQRGAEDASQRMGQAVLQAIEKAGLKAAQIAYVGLGSPGTMDIPSGKLVKPVNLKGWDDFPLRDRVSYHCGLPVAFENDANAAAYGEFWIGAGRGCHSIVLFTLGTGIGCGVIIGDLILDGANSHGAECGHMIIDAAEDARMCGCGRRGHVEAYASATAVTLRTQEALSDGRKSSISARLENGESLTPKLVAEEAAKGDAFAMDVVMETARWLGIATVNLMHTIDPDAVLLGGAMTFGGGQTELGRKFLARVKEEVDKRAFALLAERIKINFATLGGDAGYVGAAGIGRLEHAKAGRSAAQ